MYNIKIDLKGRVLQGVAYTHLPQDNDLHVGGGGLCILFKLLKSFKSNFTIIDMPVCSCHYSVNWM